MQNRLRQAFQNLTVSFLQVVKQIVIKSCIHTIGSILYGVLISKFYATLMSINFTTTGFAIYFPQPESDWQCHQQQFRGAIQGSDRITKMLMVGPHSRAIGLRWAHSLNLYLLMTLSPLHLVENWQIFTIYIC